MDTYIMTSDTMEAVPLVAASRKPENQQSDAANGQPGDVFVLVQSRNNLEFSLKWEKSSLQNMGFTLGSL